MKNFSIQILILFLIIINSCKNENIENSNPPELKVIKSDNYIWKDTSMTIGKLINIEIQVIKKSANITNFVVALNDGNRKVLLDSGLNSPEFTFKFSTPKTKANLEKWIFIVMDKFRNKDSISINITKSATAQYGKIKSFDNIIFGAQKNAQNGGFFSFQNGNKYFLTEASQNQNLIDFIYYYDIYNATLASPLETDALAIFTGTYGLSNWTIKNETKYNTTTCNVTDFDNSKNDSLIIEHYSAVDGKRKGKYALPGQIFAFRNQTGKLGLIKINSLKAGDNGNIEVTIKMQE